MASIAELQVQVMQDSERYFPALTRNLPYHALSMCGEAGEFGNEVKKIMRGTADPASSMVHHKLAMELADTFIYMLQCAAIIGIDLEKAYERKRQENHARFIKEG